MAEIKGYAVVDRTTDVVINIVAWDGESDISFLTNVFDLIPVEGREDFPYIGETYDRDADYFNRPKED